MHDHHFDFEMLYAADYEIAMRYLGKERQPDLIIAPDGHPYLFRWEVIPRNTDANVYFHVQVADDPDRPLHDHPWDNQSVILAGGYTEFVGRPGAISKHIRQPGDVVSRLAGDAHRLELLQGELYTMTQFTTGPKIRDWGFYTTHGWLNQSECVINHPDGTSTYQEPEYAAV